MGPFEGIGSILSWAHTQVTLSLVDGPTWGFPMLWANLHVGFFVLIGTILLHYVAEAGVLKGPGEEHRAGVEGAQEFLGEVTEVPEVGCSVI